MRLAAGCRLVRNSALFGPHKPPATAGGPPAVAAKCLSGAIGPCAPVAGAVALVCQRPRPARGRRRQGLRQTSGGQHLRIIPPASGAMRMLLGKFAVNREGFLRFALAEEKGRQRFAEQKRILGQSQCAPQQCFCFRNGGALILLPLQATSRQSPHRQQIQREQAQELLRAPHGFFNVAGGQPQFMAEA